MDKLKRAAAVAAMVGGIGLAGGGFAHAGDGPYPHPVVIDNLQSVECEQAFEGADGGLAITTGGGAISGDTEIQQGNFCTVIGSVED